MKQRLNSKLEQHWKHNQIWKFLCVQQQQECKLTKDGLVGERELPWSLFFYGRKPCQTNQVIENWYLWTKWNMCQKLDISKLKMAYHLPVSNWPILKKIRTIGSFMLRTQQHLKGFSFNYLFALKQLPV